MPVNSRQFLMMKKMLFKKYPENRPSGNPLARQDGQALIEFLILWIPFAILIAGIFFMGRVGFKNFNGTEVDYVDGLMGAGFKINNPNVTKSCGCGNSVGF